MINAGKNKNINDEYDKKKKSQPIIEGGLKFTIREELKFCLIARHLMYKRHVFGFGHPILDHSFTFYLPRGL